jgi:hypothetical protein
MFCWITMKNYVAENVSKCITDDDQQGTISNCSESIIFLFLGITTVNDHHEWNTAFILLTIFFCSLYRAIGMNSPYRYLVMPLILITVIKNCCFRYHHIVENRQLGLLPPSKTEFCRKVGHVLQRITWSHRLRSGPPNRSRPSSR